jgi:hypothetical protein
VNDLHAQFGAWLTAGAHGEPLRDVALHASGCPSCLELASGMDALSEIDPGRAPAPPLDPVPLASAPLRLTPRRVARAVAGLSAVGFLIAAVALTATSLLDNGGPTAELPAQPTLGEAVLGAQATPEPTAPEESATAEPSPSPSATPEEEEQEDGRRRSHPIPVRPRRSNRPSARPVPPHRRRPRRSRRRSPRQTAGAHADPDPDARRPRRPRSRRPTPTPGPTPEPTPSRPRSRRSPDARALTGAFRTGRLG